MSLETFLCLSAAVVLLAFGAVFVSLLRDGDGADGGPNGASRVSLSEDAHHLLKVGHLLRMRGARIDEAEVDRSAELLYRAFRIQDLDRSLWPLGRLELVRAALNVVGYLAMRAADGQEDPEQAARLAREINGRLFGDPPYGRFHLLELLGEEIGSWPRRR
jgi:hypothetical protein